MVTKADITQIPWDKRAFNLDCYEIHNYSREIFESIIDKPGHYTIKIDPLSPKLLLHEFGFYYCDTLLEPSCSLEHFKPYQNAKTHIELATTASEAQELSLNMFKYDRFHRDFNIADHLADLRYQNWIKDIFDRKQLYNLVYENNPAGFIGCNDNKLVLHAMHPNYQGKGLAKYFWSQMCLKLFDQGHTVISSSISSANLPVIALYQSLGFRFGNAVDIYHCLVT